jgi:hypothetical protein
VDQWLVGIREQASNGSVSLCSERTACGEYLCDGEKPLETNRTVQISPVSAFINAELRRDPGYLTKANGIARALEPSTGNDTEVGPAAADSDANIETNGLVRPNESTANSEGMAELEPRGVDQKTDNGDGDTTPGDAVATEVRTEIAASSPVPIAVAGEQVMKDDHVAALEEQTKIALETPDSS